MSRRADGLHKPVVILAGVFANRLLSTVEQRFAVRLVGDEFIDFDNVDFTNVSLAIVFGCGHRIAERHLNKATFIIMVRYFHLAEVRIHTSGAGSTESRME